MSANPLMTEDTIAMSLAGRESARLRYVVEWKRWIFCGSDGLWRLDQKNTALQLVRLACREASASAEVAGDAELARLLASYKTVSGVELFARCDPRLTMALRDVPEEVHDPKSGRCGPHGSDR